MFRGTCEFTCDNCGNKFVGMDCEWCATILTAPMKCPKCGSMHTCPSGNAKFYRELWKSMDERNQNDE